MLDGRGMERAVGGNVVKILDPLRTIWIRERWLGIMWEKGKVNRREKG